MLYKEVIENLSLSIDNKNKDDLFNISIQQLKNNFGISVSSEFLRSLSSLSENKARKRINYLLAKNGYKRIDAIKPITTEKTLIYSAFIPEHNFKELCLTNNAKNSKNPIYTQFFKNCGDLEFIEKKASAKNKEIFQNYKVASEKIYHLIV